MDEQPKRTPPPGPSPRLLPVLVAALGFAVLFWEPAALLLRDWWNEPEAGHGLLLAPLAGFLMWKSGLDPRRSASPVLGLLLIAAGITLRLASELAAELFTMRFSMVLTALGLVVFVWGLRQVRRWWLPVALVTLSIPLPYVVLSTLALPLQLQASQLGTSLLEWRDVPVLLSGNVIHLPGQSLFVTEACSGLRSLTALISLGLLMGGLWLQSSVSRLLILALAIPVAMVLNGIRVFLTGFLVFFVDPALGDGFMHYTEGWALFVVAFVILGALTALMANAEGWITRRFPRASLSEVVA